MLGSADTGPLTGEGSLDLPKGLGNYGVIRATGVVPNA